MKIVRLLLQLATVAGLSATIAAPAPVSRFVLGTHTRIAFGSYYRPLVAADSQGNSYLATTLIDIIDRPLHDGGEYPIFKPIFSKVSKDGKVLFSENLAGGTIYAMAVGPSGDVYLAGASIASQASNSIDFQWPANPPIQATDGALNASPALGYVAHYTPDGSVVFVATLTAVPFAVAIDPSGAVYLTGAAGQGFPTNPTSFQPVVRDQTCPPLSGADPQSTCNAFVAKISPDGSKLMYATFLGGSGTDIGRAVAVNAAGSSYIAGNTTSTDFPRVGTTQSPSGGSGHVFVAELDPSGSTLVSSVVIGGSGSDSAAALAIDSSGAAYVAGQTSSADFPVTLSACQPVYGGGANDAYVFKLDSTGRIVFSTFLGGPQSDEANGMVLNTDGRLYVSVDSTDGRGLYSALLRRPQMDCDPVGLLVALDPVTGDWMDYEGLIGFSFGAGLAGDGSGVLHVYDEGVGNSDFVITDGTQPGNGALLAHIDFTKSDVFQPACVANIADHSWATSAASYFGPISGSNPLLPGEIITIQGKGLGPAEGWQAQPDVALPYQVASTQVTLGGNPLPLLYVSDTEIQAVVPYSQATSSPATLNIRNGDYEFTDSFGVNPFGASVFTRDSSGLAAAINADGSINSTDNPAGRGSVVSLFATGLGQLNPASPDNMWSPLEAPWPSLIAQPEIFIGFPINSGGGGAPILYAGLAPGEAPGVYQINVQIPEATPAGNIPFEIGYSVNGVYYQSSRQALQIAVK